eukprot:2650827-Alexandrium_andersonii.AAC.1
MRLRHTSRHGGPARACKRWGRSAAWHSSRNVSVASKQREGHQALQQQAAERTRSLTAPYTEDPYVRNACMDRKTASAESWARQADEARFAGGAKDSIRPRAGSKTAVGASERYVRNGVSVQ